LFDSAWVFSYGSSADYSSFFSDRIAWLCLEACVLGPQFHRWVVEQRVLSQRWYSKQLKLLNIAGVVPAVRLAALFTSEVMDKKGLQIHGSSREVIRQHARNSLKFWPRLFDIKAPCAETVPKWPQTKTTATSQPAAEGS